MHSLFPIKSRYNYLKNKELHLFINFNTYCCFFKIYAYIWVLCGSLKDDTTRKTMNKKRVTTILIFLFCVTIPILTLSLFPTPCGYGLCLLIYYPIIFLVGGLSAWTFYKFSDKIKFSKTIFLIIILVLDLT